MNKETDEKLKNMSIVKLILRLIILCFSVVVNQMEYGITAIGVTLFIMLLSYINVNLDKM